MSKKLQSSTFGVRQLFAGVVFSSVGLSKEFENLANVSSIPRTIDDASELPQKEPKIEMLDFAIFPHSNPSRIEKTTTDSYGTVLRGSVIAAQYQTCVPVPLSNKCGA